ncbi:5304_t:CDS:1, partial [Gigaspora rosea]
KIQPNAKENISRRTTFSENTEEYKNFRGATKTQTANKRKTQKVMAQTRI